jgi:hypothetical protein
MLLLTCRVDLVFTSGAVLLGGVRKKMRGLKG